MSDTGTTEAMTTEEAKQLVQGQYWAKSKPNMDHRNMDHRKPSYGASSVVESRFAFVGEEFATRVAAAVNLLMGERYPRDPAEDDGCHKNQYAFVRKTEGGEYKVSIASPNSEFDMAALFAEKTGVSPDAIKVIEEGNPSWRINKAGSSDRAR